MSRSVLERLRPIELFGGCRRSQLAAIDQLGCALRVGEDRTLCTEGTPGAEFFVLLEGDVEVRTNAGAHAILHDGGWFGEIALLDLGARRATVRTLTGSTVLVFDRREFATLLRIAPLAHLRLHYSMRRLLTGAPPTTRPWYEPAGQGPAPRATVNA